MKAFEAEAMEVLLKCERLHEIFEVLLKCERLHEIFEVLQQRIHLRRPEIVKSS